MITFLDERDVEHGALATIKVTNAVNGERSLTGEIESGDYVLSNIERGWRLRFDDEFYVVTYAKPIDDGKTTHVTFDAVHQFFWDFDKSSVHEQLNDGSHTFLTYLDFIFTGSDYTYTIDPLLKVYAFEKQSFGYKSRLKLFNDVITSSGVEFQVNGKVIRILEKTGTDLSTVVRKNFNMNELDIEKNIGDFVTYQKGFGAWVDENDHTKGRLVTEYTSPLASVYGKLEAEPLVDERYTQADNMIAALKANVDNSYSISVRLDMEDLTRAGYEYTQPRAGDYIMAINETLDFQEKIRIVSFTSEYDVTGQLIKHEVTCNDIGAVKKLSASYTLTKEQAQNASATVVKAVEMANKALVSADGKSTVYFGTEFPEDEPKGELHKGDSLYLTVGDTTKMYYWTGADWEELPIVNDVKAFQDQINDELKDIPDREEVESTINQKIATSKAEIKTQIDTAKTQAESNAKAYADEINQATAEVAEQANTTANSLKSDLAKVKTDLTTTTSTANAAKTSASEAKQQLTTVANDLSKAKAETVTASNQLKQRIDATSAQLDTQQQELAQATQNVKGLDTQIKSVSSQLGTQQTTITQLVNDGNARGQKIANFETSLDGVTTKLQNLWNGSRNLLSNTETLTGMAGVLPYPKNHYLNKAVFRWTHKATDTAFKEGLVMQVNDMLVNPKEMILSFYANASTQTTVRCYMHNPNGQKDVETSSGYTATDSADGLAEVVIQPGWNRYWVRYTYKVGYVAKPYVIIGRSADTVTTTTTLSIVAPALYHGHYNRDWQPSDVDMSSAFAVYKQTADQNYASLQSNLQTLDGTVKSNKATADQTAEGFKTRIESLETYKSGESTRANQYFESAKTETARQLTAERTAIAKDYVAKSTYTSDVTGIRNDLTATTTTANTTKTNLASYQASNDQAVASLQSSLQTTDGNVSSLQTQINAVPGQITSAVSAVEGKIPTNVSTRNLILKSNDFAHPPKQNGNNTTVTSTDDYFVIKSTGYTANAYGGMSWNMSISEVKAGEEFSILMPVYIDSSVNLDSGFSINIKNHTLNAIAYDYDIPTNKKDEWFNVAITFKPYKDVVLDAYPFYVYLVKNGLVRIKPPMLVRGNLIPSDYQPAFEDTESDISQLNTTLTQTANGLEQLSTQVTSQGNTIASHTNSINSLATGLSAKVSQSDFNTLSGRVTTAENNITAKANELSSKITSVEGKIPSGEMNLVEYGRPADGYSPYKYAEYATHPFYYNSAFKMYIIKNTTTTEKLVGMNRFKVERNTDYTLYFKGFNNSAITNMDVWFLKRVSGSTKDFDSAQILVSSRKLSISKAEDVSVTFNTGNYDEGYIRFDNNGSTTAGAQADLYFGDVSVKKGKSNNGWSPSQAELASSQDLKNAQSEIKQTTDAISASVSALDSSTVKTASLTIGTDGVVMKAGKSTSDIANAIGSYFSVNQNAINLFSDKINVKGSMIVDGAITSTKIASKSINTAHLNGKIITADVIATGAITADAIKAGAVTTSAMSANSINGDRITAGTLDAAKIKAGSITASQIASGTITSAQIKTGTISAGNIATGAITTDKIAANSINSDKIVSSGITANVIKGGVLKALNNAMQVNLDDSNITFSNNASVIFTSSDNAIKRVITGKPTQFIKMYDDGFFSEIGELPDSTLTVIGSNSDRTESSGSLGFGGLRIWNGRSSTDTTSFVELVGNRVAIYGNKNRSPWLFDMTTTTSSLIPQNSNGIKHSLGRSDRPFHSVYANDMYIQGERVAMMLKDIALYIGYQGNNGWVNRIG